MRRLAWATLLLMGCSGPDDALPNAQGGAAPGGAPSGGAPTGGTQAGGALIGGQPASAGVMSAGGTTGGAASGSSGSGGASVTGGGGAGSGGSSAGGGGGVNCAERWAEYDALAKSARLCDPSAATPECKFNVVVLDACGCSVPANGSSPDYASAWLRLTKYVEGCEFPEECAGCPSTLDAACKDDGNGVSQCVYQ